MTMAKSVDDFKTKHDPLTIIRRLETELRTANEQIGIEEAIKGLLGTASQRLDALDPPAWIFDAPTELDAPGVPMLFLSDLHWGEVVDPAQINGVNKFNVSIAQERLQRTIKTTMRLLHLLDHQKRYPGIVVALGGDMISGNIHDELMATNEINTMPTVLDLYEHLVSALKTLADEYGKVFVPCVSGNHGRDTKKTWSKDRNATSFDWLLYQFLARHFAGDDRFSFYVPAGSDALFRIHNTRFLLTHGDQFKAGDSIIGPLGPLTRGAQKKQARNQAVDQEFDVMMCGHWHQLIFLSYLLVNGSLKGYDEYAAQGNFRFEPPQQALITVHPDYGINWRMPVLCEKPVKRKKAPWVSAFGG